MAAPVVPATWEAEAGESPEPRRHDTVSQDHATAPQPGQQGEALSQKKSKNYPTGEVGDERRREH